MHRFAARLLHAAATVIGWLPWPWLRHAADTLAWAWWRMDARESRVTRRNLELAYPELLAEQRAQWHRAILRTTARQALETVHLWTRPHAANLALIRRSEGVELFDAALSAGRGVIVIAPHYGNWELLHQWLAARAPVTILYRPPDSATGEAFLRRVRADHSGRVTQARAEGQSIRLLYRSLQKGGVVGILPDQQPKAGDGEFVPFFGIQALTMTLVGRLAERSGAAVLFAYCERTGPDLEFALRVEAAPAGIAAADPRIAAGVLNMAVERIARRDPSQYQWTYKRYTLRPPGSGQDNPYRDLEHGR